MTEFYLVRHGQTTANAQGLKQGTINTPITQLSVTGKNQAQRLHNQFDISFADRMVVSPLDRTRETAAILNQTADLPTTVDERLLEISYGDWDGQANQELEKQFPDVFDPVLHDVLPTYVEVAAGGETFQHVMGRIHELMRELTAQAPTDKIILVTHGFTIKAAVLATTGLAETEPLPEPENTSVTKISFSAKTDQFYLWYYNRFDANTYV